MIKEVLSLKLLQLNEDYYDFCNSKNEFFPKSAIQRTKTFQNMQFVVVFIVFLPSY